MRQAIERSLIAETSRDRAWSFLWDIEALAKCIPGCEDVIVEEPGKRYKARMRRSVGPFLVRFELDIGVEQCIPLERVQVMVTGQDKRLRSQIRQRVTVLLSSSQDGRCQIDLTADLQLDGMLASLGERLLGAQIEQEVDGFVHCIQGKLHD